ncbi:MAG: efflux RND transporter permease subunit [Geminicoccaceae bacterium]
MNLPRFAVSHRPIILSLVILAIGIGLFNLATMPRREDPEIIIRNALVVTAWPGASAKRVEELVTDPLEAATAEIAEVATIESKSLVGLSIIEVTLDDSVDATDQVWDDLRAKIRVAEGALPDGVARPFVNSDFGDVYEIVFALYQLPVAGQDQIDRPYSPRELEVYAEQIEDELELIEAVGKVDLWGVQPERIYVEVDSADLAKLELTASDLQRTIQARNIVTPGGELNTDRGRYAVAPTGEFSTVRQIEDLVIARQNGTLPVRLGDLPIQVDRRYAEPRLSLTRFSAPGTPHLPGLVLAVSMKSGRNVVEMSQAVDDTIATLGKTALPPDLSLTRVNDLARQVDTRIQDFQINLLQGVAIVLFVALIAMGWRPALVMAAAVPLSMLAAIALVRPLGIELEQFAIASLIIALGLVVDNAIVISDNVVRLIREGRSKLEACVQGAQDLAIPMLAATLTTIFAFLPMLTMVGNVGEYISSLPVVVTATLVASYVGAMVVTPITCLWLLKGPSSSDQAAGSGRFGAGYEQLISWSLSHKALVLGLTGLAFLASLLIIPVIGNQFFPSGQRDQFFIKVWLPEGATIETTSRITKEVEEAVLSLDGPEGSDGEATRLANIVTFIGTGGPRLMLTQAPDFDSPYYALLVVNTTDPGVTDDVVAEAKERLARFHEARIAVDKFVLGPPVDDPVAFRVSGSNHAVLRRAADEMVRQLKATSGARQVYSNWGATGYQVDVEIDPDAANLAGVTNADIALTLQTIISGAELTRFREGDHLVPVLFRTLREKREDLADLTGIYVNGADGKVPLEAIATLEPSWQPAVIARRDRIPTVTIAARTEEDVLANDVASRVMPAFEAIVAGLPDGYRLEQGGEQEETIKALSQVVSAVLLTIVLILLVLIAQYNQFLKPLIIMLTIPLALIGVLVGLLVTGWALGFMANLGLLALAGIVPNNAIVLIDFIETRVAAGTDLRRAVAEAGRLRMRPILLTTATTIGGLLPLSLFGGPLWAPMTNGMIFGLIFSTALTLVVVPVLYVTFAERFSMRVV